MGYRKINNLYQSKDILMFKQCYALEKIHGTSAHVSYNSEKDSLHFSSGGAKHERFLKIFDHDKLLESFRLNAAEHPASIKVGVYGEAYGGKLQGMSDTYGKELKFIAFEVRISDDSWLGVKYAETIANKLGFDFVDYELISTTEEDINREMMRDSVQAVRNGMGEGKMREGIVLRPLVELIHPNGGRVICKHKRPEFAERENTPKFDDPEKLKILEEAKAIADEWVNDMRLQHVLDAFTDPDMKDMNKIIKAMVADVYSESDGEIVQSREAKKAIGKKTAKLFIQHLNSSNFNG